jgi:hypothetical protein
MTGFYFSLAEKWVPQQPNNPFAGPPPPVIPLLKQHIPLFPLKKNLYSLVYSTIYMIKKECVKQPKF